MIYNSWGQHIRKFTPEAENHPQTSKITVPVLSIFGTADKALSVSAAEGGVDFVEKFESILLDGVSHWSPEEKPDEINATSFSASQAATSRQWREAEMLVI